MSIRRKYVGIITMFLRRSTNKSAAFWAAPGIPRQFRLLLHFPGEIADGKTGWLGTQGDDGRGHPAHPDFVQIDSDHFHRCRWIQCRKSVRIPDLRSFGPELDEHRRSRERSRDKWLRWLLRFCSVPGSTGRGRCQLGRSSCTRHLLQCGHQDGKQ